MSRDLHMHTVYSDGKSTAEEMILSAIDKGLDCVGISDHSHELCDTCGMELDQRAEYRAEIKALGEKYADRIRVLCGLERDYYSDDDDAYDYIIGAVHAIGMPDGHYISVDWRPDALKADVDCYYGGDWYAMTEAYYGLVEKVADVTRCDIIGHFDLVSKFNEQNAFFDETHPRYRAAWQRAADALLKTEKPFEINVGAISRGYRTTPYPSEEIRTYLRERGARFLLSSDSHQPENVAFQFERWRKLLTPEEWDG